VLADNFYYLHNFERVLDSIACRYSDLLDESETRFVSNFTQMPKTSRALAVRMIMRTRRLFLAEHLQYPEIGAAPDAAAALVDAGWVGDDPLLSLDDLFAVFTKTRLCELLRLPRRLSLLTKSVLLEHCRTAFAIPLKVADWFPNARVSIFRLEIGALCERLRLLYFGNFHQGWSEFVLADLGVRRFERVDQSSFRPFANREQWTLFAQIGHCRELLHNEENQPLTVLAQVPDRIVGCDWLESRRQRLLFRVAHGLERAGDPLTALSVYSGLSHPGAMVRSIRIKEATDEAAPTLAACEAALTECKHTLDHNLLMRAQKRLRRKLGLPQQAAATERGSHAEILTLVLQQPEQRYCVEQMVGDFLMQQECSSEVYFVENCLLNGLFGLLCWRALFAPIAGAFFHPFHREPADLSDAHFFERRRDIFGACLAELDDVSYQSTILSNYEAKNGIDNTFVAWGALRRKLLTQALACIPARHLKPWFELMARDFHANRNGFPDLIQFWPEERRYRLIEVKAPGDRLQDNQRRILSLCARFGMPATVCKVQWSNRS
jgi:hypothetical protein